MAKVLTDLISLSDFESVYASNFGGDNLKEYVQHFQLIENLILCEKVVVEVNGVHSFSLEEMCNTFDDAFGYIQDERLYDKSGDPGLLNEENRILLYSDVARKNEIYYSPHPDRKEQISREIESSINSTTNKVIEYADQKIISTKSGEAANINIKVPPVIEHALYASKSKQITLVESINEIRNSRNARKFREYMSDIDGELRNLTPRKKIEVFQPLFRDIDRLCNMWMGDLDDNVRFVQRKANLSKLPVVGALLKLLGLAEVEFKDPVILPSDSHLLFLNDIYRK